MFNLFSLLQQWQSEVSYKVKRYNLAKYTRPTLWNLSLSFLERRVFTKNIVDTYVCRQTAVTSDLFVDVLFSSAGEDNKM